MQDTERPPCANRDLRELATDVDSADHAKKYFERALAARWNEGDAVQEQVYADIHRLKAAYPDEFDAVLAEMGLDPVLWNRFMNKDR